MIRDSGILNIPKMIIKGYGSLLRDGLGLRNSKEFLVYSTTLTNEVIILGLIGIARSFESVLLHIHLSEKWYSMDFDVILTMFFFPIYLCYFSAFMFDIWFRLTATNIDRRKLLSYLFFLQGIHLLIPLLDFVGLKNKIPWFFYFPPLYAGNFFFKPIVFTLGIILGWVFALYMTLKVLVYHLKINILKSLMAIFIVFNVLYWPIYHVWPTFNTVFHYVLTHRLPHYMINGDCYGYGIFFMVSAFIGIAYFKKLRVYE